MRYWSDCFKNDKIRGQLFDSRQVFQLLGFHIIMSWLHSSIHFIFGGIFSDFHPIGHGMRDWGGRI